MTITDESAMTYHPSGRVRLVVLLCVLVPVLAASLVMGAVLFWVFTTGWYLIILLPAVAAAGVMYVLGGAIGLAHCRNRLVGGLIGLAAGLTTYLGYYYVGMVHDAGIEFAARVDVLPAYIQFRMRCQGLPVRFRSRVRLRKATPSKERNKHGYSGPVVRRRYYCCCRSSIWRLPMIWAIVATMRFPKGSEVLAAETPRAMWLTSTGACLRAASKATHVPFIHTSVQA